MARQYTPRAEISVSFPRTALIAAILLCVPFSLLGEEELSYTVRPGDTLEKVIEEFGTEGVSVDELRRFNNLKSVRRIPPGTKIRFQLGWLKIKPLQAVAAAVSGEARVIRAGQEKTEEVQEGDGFKPGDVLETGADSSVLLKFGDGSRLLLQGNSALAF
ncbi:MAG TPA: LysM peptidoglycan-binding domain-containing protein, partial [Gammaproteobacteria bacterium]|nr:LysM peptidoglycan-binding domain-containing protein [Gammaproteobacteria bacterium]